MNRSALLLTALFGIGLVAVAGSWVRWRTPATTGGAAYQSAPTYTCPMHPAYRSDHPGDCPLCGMRLVLVKSGSDPAKGGAAVAEAPDTAQIDTDKQQLMGVRIDEVPPASASHLTLRVPGRV